MATTYMTVRPAYGRVLHTQAQVREYFLAGRDFQITDVGKDEGRMVSRPGLPAGMRLQVRYGTGGTKVMVVP